jgi:NAD(P)H-dependent flavin oxidoreductase YrpB (nitropropane dioxygenase family)
VSLRELLRRTFALDHVNSDACMKGPRMPVHHILRMMANGAILRGASEKAERPSQLPDLIPESFQVILEERAPVFSVGLGNQGAEMVEACHCHDIKVIAPETHKKALLEHSANATTLTDVVSGRFARALLLEGLSHMMKLDQ